MVLPGKKITVKYLGEGGKTVEKEVTVPLAPSPDPTMPEQEPKPKSIRFVAPRWGGPSAPSPPKEKTTPPPVVEPTPEPTPPPIVKPKPTEWEPVQTGAGRAEMRQIKPATETKPAKYEFRVIGDVPGKTVVTHRGVARRKGEIRLEQQQQWEEYKTEHGLVETETGAIKGKGIYIDPSYGTLEERLSLLGRHVVESEYRITKQVPEEVRSQITVPEQVIALGLSDLYYQLAYERSLRHITKEEAEFRLQEAIGEKLAASPDEGLSWIKTYGVFGAEVKPEEWHPETKLDITKTPGGFYKYDIQFPYPGAERYYPYKKSLEKAGFFGLLATAFTAEDPLGLASAYYQATGEKQRALDIKIKALHGFTTKSFLEYYISSPITAAGVIPATFGLGIGVPTTYAGGVLAAKYGAGSLAAWSLKWGMAGAGGVAIGLSAADIQKTLEVEGPGEAFGKTVLYGFQFAAAIGGYRAAARTTVRGATPYEYGFRRGFKSHIRSGMKKGEIDLITGSRVLQASRLEFDLRRGLRGVVPYQEKPDFRVVQTLEQQRGLREFFPKHLVRRKVGVFGSLSEGRAEVHDLDIMYRNYAQGLREAQYAAARFKAGDVAQYADIKTWQATGKIVGRMGTVKQPWYKTPEGYKLGRISESAMRHGESALELAHPGRAKDIPRAVELYTTLFEAKGRPRSLLQTLADYTDVMTRLEQQPLVMPKEESLFLYGGKSLAERWAGLKTKVYTRVAPKGWEEISFRKTMGIPIVESKGIKPIGRGLPPTPSVSLVPSGISSIVASAFFPPSISYEPSGVSVGIPSVSISPAGKPVSISPPSKRVSIIPSGKTISVSPSQESVSVSPSSKLSSVISNISSKVSSNISNVSSIISSSISSSISKISIFPSPSKSISPSSSQSYLYDVVPPVVTHAGFPFLSGIEPKMKEQQGFNVHVKERYIFEGKKVRPERLVKIKIHPLIETEAHALGQHLTEHSAAQTYTIKPVAGSPKPLRLDIDFGLGYKFYKKGKNFIERREYAIDTPGERQEITAQSIFSGMKKDKRLVSDLYQLDIGKEMEKQLEKMRGLYLG